ncbi:MAG: hypothetical protein ACO3YX_08045 [Candidatus Nanopelagicaceae bacterium]
MDKEQQVEWARRYLVDAWQSFQKQNGSGWCAERNNLADCYVGGKHLGGAKSLNKDWHTLPYRILTASPHLQGISGHEEILDKLLESMPLLEALEILERELG